MNGFGTDIKKEVKLSSEKPLSSTKKSSKMGRPKRSDDFRKITINITEAQYREVQLAILDGKFKTMSEAVEKGLSFIL